MQQQGLVCACVKLLGHPIKPEFWVISCRLFLRLKGSKRFAFIQIIIRRLSTSLILKKYYFILIPCYGVYENYTLLVALYSLHIGISLINETTSLFE